MDIKKNPNFGDRVKPVGLTLALELGSATDSLCVHVTLLYPFFPPCKMEISSNYLWTYE